jgi:post-segregation antitoxin (ccd killing protein)
MRTVARFGAYTLSIALVVVGGWLSSAGSSAVLVRSQVEVTKATPQQLDLIRWAVGRFEAAGLEPPAVEIEFHDDPNGCGGHLGYAKAGHVDVCTALVNAATRRAPLHEMSHAWLEQNARPSTVARFLDLRGLTSWNSSRDPWPLRGCEQAAEIISWALGERILTAQIPDNDPRHMDDAYRLLTGGRLPQLDVLGL